MIDLASVLTAFLVLSYGINAVPLNDQEKDLNYEAKLVDFEGLTASDVVQNQFMVVLKECSPSALRSHYDSFVSELSDTDQDFTIVRKYQIRQDFCGYLFHHAATSDSIQAQDGDNAESFAASMKLQFLHPSLQSILANPLVEYVVPNHRVKVSGFQPNSPYNLARISSRGIPKKSDYYYDDSAGFGVDAYILDSGILASHVEFEGRARVAAEFLQNEEDFTTLFERTGDDLPQTDENGHGTHVAGIVGAKTYGVAKQANLIGIKVLFTDGSGVWSNVIAGIEFAVNSFMCRKKPAVINISISGPPSRALRDAVVSAVKLGIPVVVAAGNDEIDACGASPSNIKYNGVFVVGSINEQDEFSQFSNYGECVNILAPGEGVISAYTNPTGYPATNNYGAYMSGTSQAAPHVSGVIAMYLSSFTLRPQELSSLIMNSTSNGYVVQINSDTPNKILYAPKDLDVASSLTSN